jgi:hypothetical protein
MVFFTKVFRKLSLCKMGDFLIIFALNFSAQNELSDFIYVEKK